MRPTLRKLLLRAVLGCLVLTAAVAIAHVWTGSDDGRVLASCFVITLGSLLGLCGAAQLERRPGAPIGLATLVTSTMAGGLTLLVIWSNPSSDIGRLLVCSWLWAVASALHSLVSLARLPRERSWVAHAAPLALHAATALTTALIYELVPESKHLAYVLATLYILATLASLAVLVIHVMHRHVETETTEAGLELVPVEGEIYEDPRSARRYRVVPLN